MGGFFGAVSHRNCEMDVFFGTDYHSHLGTKRGGMAAVTNDGKFVRFIHNIENTPFRTKFEDDLMEMQGKSCIGCISDTDPQPLLIKSALGVFAICTIGIINNAEALVNELISAGRIHFEAMTSGKINSVELVAALINEKKSFVEGIRYAEERIDGSLSILILNSDGSIIAARDKLGRLPILIGKNSDGYCVSFESFAYQKLGYEDVRDLRPAEIVKLTADSMEVLREGQDDMRICAFLWSYYGYPNSKYEGKNVEVVRTKNGEIMAREDQKNGLCEGIDYVCGVPDSGTPHAIGYSNESGIPFARPFIKYTPTWPRSFMPTNQAARNKVAKMKMIPVHELIEGKSLLFVDDSIVRGTQLRETVEFLYNNGAKEVHMRSACPPIMYGCKYLNFSSSRSDMELIARRTIAELEGSEGEKHISEYSSGNTKRGKAMRECICKQLGLKSLEFQSLEGLLEAIGLDRSKICTYCWDGKE
ncbi:MAG: amidophosphoribosyltransferase [Clostridia bacterium]|nr:amidophosphoribosyltransferase [Clostridia bacterium]